jgi:hypothetical protein
MEGKKRFFIPRERENNYALHSPPKGRVAR